MIRPIRKVLRLVRPDPYCPINSVARRQAGWQLQSVLSLLSRPLDCLRFPWRSTIGGMTDQPNPWNSVPRFVFWVGAMLCFVHFAFTELWATATKMVAGEPVGPLHGYMLWTFVAFVVIWPLSMVIALSQRKSRPATRPPPDPKYRGL